VNRGLIMVAAGVPPEDRHVFDEVDALARLLDARQAILDGR